MNPDAANLQLALDWLTGIVAGRLNVHFGKSGGFEANALNYHDDDSWLPRFIRQRTPNFQEFTIQMLALAPHVEPNLLGKLIATHLPDGGDFPEFGGVKGLNHRGILPTGETAQFILAGDDLEKRLEVQRILSSEHWFSQKHILWLEPVREGEPVMSGRLVLDPEILSSWSCWAWSDAAAKSSRPAFFIIPAISTCCL